MAESLFSARWHRVARLRPQLRPQVQVRQQSQRGTDWYLLVDPSAEEVRRINRSAYAFVGRCDGHNTVDQIWQALLQLHPEEAMTQEEALRLMVQLHERRLLQFDASVDVEALFVQNRRERRQRRARRANPLAFQVVLGNPERLLERLRVLGMWMYSPLGIVLWLLLVGGGVASALVHLPELEAHADNLMSTPRWMFLAWLLYPAIKLVHEAAHGLAVHRWGGRVREFGVLLLAMVPVPFVNASAADGFRFRHQRALVSAAGIMAELAMAAAAMLLWPLLQASLLRDLALLVAITGLLSTLLVNGNPLMRFDGYFLLCDLLDLRNLAPRSARWWADVAQRRVLGVGPSAPLEALPGERGWLFAYAPLALVYRLVLSFAIVLWLGNWSALLGALLGLYLGVTLVAWPLWRLVRGTGRAIGAQPRRLAPAARALAAGVLVLLLFALPLPFGTVAQGVVWMPERAQIRAGTDGFVEALLVADGQSVAAGDVLVRMRDDRLDLEWARLDADRAGLETQMFQAIVSKPEEVPALRERLQYVEAGLLRVAEQRTELEVRAQVPGRVVLPRPEELAGRFFRKGALLGHVGTGDPMVIRVALPQDQAQLVRERRGPIAVRLAQDGGLQEAHAARLQRDMEAAVARLPSRALGDRGGGAVVTRADDPEGLTPREPVVLMDLDVPTVRSHWVGSRVAVRFDHGHMDLATQLVRRIRQLVLERFDVQG